MIICLHRFSMFLVVYSPFWEHVLGFKDLENQEHLMIISFEEMKKVSVYNKLKFF